MNARVTGAFSAPAELMSNYSLEMTAKDVGSLTEARGLIPPGTPVSVTYLPGEELPARVAAAKAVRDFGFVPVPHISARRLGSIETLTEFLDTLREEVGIERAFVVAGDPPEPLGPYQDALAVIRSGLLARANIRQIGISGYPEGHPDIPEAKLWQAMRDKIAALADIGCQAEIMTQFAFDSDAILRWLEKLRDAGVTAPVRIGVAGPTSVRTLLRFAGRCGVGASAKVMTKYGISITRLLDTAGPDRLIVDLASRLDPTLHGHVMLHLYPFGSLSRTASWAHDYLRKKAA